MQSLIPCRQQSRLAGRPATCVLIALFLTQPFFVSLLAEDWRMWGGDASRNNVTTEEVPTHWRVGKFDRRTGKWDSRRAENIKWTARLGSQTYGCPVISGGSVFIGTNNGAGYVSHYPANIDAGCLLCLDSTDGSFRWQYTAEKLASGRVQDWPMQGICSTPAAEEDRIWFVDNRGCVVCLDHDGFLDGEDDGPIVDESVPAFQLVLGLPGGSPIPVSSRVLNDRAAITTLLAAHGVEGRWEVKKRPQAIGGGWDVRTWGGKKETYRIAVNDRQVAVYLSEDDSVKLFDSSLAILTALNAGGVSNRLRELFRQAGFELSTDATVRSAPGERSWTITSRSPRGDVVYDLAARGIVLSVDRRLGTVDVREADVVWRLDMINELGVSPHNIANGSPAIWGDLLFVGTSNGVDETHVRIPNPDAPSFLALDKRTGELIWSDATPGEHVLHGQWSSPAVGEIGGVAQVIFAGGDGWLYSFRADRWNVTDGTPSLLWKFDANPKNSVWKTGGRGDRNNLIANPVIADELVYVAVGQDPDNSEGAGGVWCIDPTRLGDVSAELAVSDRRGQRIPVPRRRVQAVDANHGEQAIENLNSAVRWHYARRDRDGDGKFDYDEQLHRTLGSPVVHDGLLFLADFSGIFHCLDAQTGQPRGAADLLAQTWTTPLVAGRHVYVGDEDGEVAVFPLASFAKPSTAPRESHSVDAVAENQLDSSIYATPSVAGGVLYVADRSRLYAITSE